MKEIEYKFLVDLEKWQAFDKPDPIRITQGYLKRSEAGTVRVRVKGDKGYLTIKGPTVGIFRDEFEYQIPVDEAREILSTLIDKCIDKWRYNILHEGRKWEVDVFLGKLEGLVLAELEVSSESEEFNKPNWIGEDVSTNPNYFNAVLIDSI